ncbi:PQ loop repeat-domain-containing protein, partial [Gilbertella persicaria]|uniref:PQ loop repeat-domain-containing protein n=1 Tax=Gilbertella persicaria TaxID=101096 RepID=UPI00222086C6
GKRFDNTLLFQSIVMLIAMMALLFTVVKYKPTNVPFTPLIRHDSISSDSSDSRHAAEIERHIELKWYQRTFWDWDHFLDYLNCLLIFTTFVGVLYLSLHQYSVFIEVLGFLSLGCEATLPLPQLLTNFKHKSTEGFSLLILGSWFIGDGFKAFYFIHQRSPVQFVACAIIQLTFDTAIVLQFIFFSTYVKKLLGIRNDIMLQDDESDRHSHVETIA